MRRKGFLPIADKHCRILIVGTLPGPDSLSKREYYGHYNNKFWPIMMSLLGGEVSWSYKKRTHRLLEHGIALWDVYESAVRPGASDSDIRSPKLNDFGNFFARFTGIKEVYCNGKRAYVVFGKNFGHLVESVSVLPSTSPAFAKSFEWKKRQWAKIIKR